MKKRIKISEKRIQISEKRMQISEKRIQIQTVDLLHSALNQKTLYPTGHKHRGAENQTKRQLYRNYFRSTATQQHQYFLPFF